MKTRMLAMALDRGRVELSNDQAAGFVSRMIESKEGDWSVAVCSSQRYCPGNE